MSENPNIYIDIKAISDFFIKNIKVFSLVFLLATFSSFFYSYIQPEKFTSYLIIGPASEDSSISNSLDKIGNIFPFSGNLSKSDDFEKLNDFFITLESLQIMLETFDPRPKIFSSNFSQESGSFDDIIYLDQRLLMNNLMGLVEINKLRNTGYLEISIQSEDTNFSENLLFSIYKSNENLAKKKKKDVAEKKLNWLNDQIQNSSYVLEKENLSTLALKEMNLLSLIDADVPIVSQIITGPYSSINPTSPNYLLNMMVFLILSFVSTIIFLRIKK